MRVLSIGLVALISFIGVWIFKTLNLPVPWLLGPLFAVLISQFFIKVKLVWPAAFRNLGLLIIGASIGQAFLFDLFAGAGWLILYMLLLNILLVVISVLIAFGVQKMGKTTLKTALTCTVAGGLSQIVSFAEEEKGIDLATVTYFHVVRVISIVMIIPFILSTHAVKAEGTGLKLEIIGPLTLLLMVAACSVWVGKRLKLPVPYFLSPVILMIVFNLFHIKTIEIPTTILHIAQALIGAYIGLLLKPDMIKLGKRVLLLGVVSALMLLAVTFGQGMLLTHFLGYSIPTSFLSTAAGGLDQMSILAAAVGGDISVVTVFQLFRLLFVFLIVLPLLKVACVYIDKKKLANKL